MAPLRQASETGRRGSNLPVKLWNVFYIPLTKGTENYSYLIATKENHLFSKWAIILQLSSREHHPSFKEHWFPSTPSLLLNWNFKSVTQVPQPNYADINWLFKAFWILKESMCPLTALCFSELEPNLTCAFCPELHRLPVMDMLASFSKHPWRNMKPMHFFQNTFNNKMIALA